MRGSGGATGVRTEGQTGGRTGRAPPPRPECRVTPGAACPDPGGAGARPVPPTCAPSGLEPATPRDTVHLRRGPRGPGKRLSKVAARATLRKFAGILLGSIDAPTCFKTKCEGENSPGPACLPPAPLPECCICRARLFHRLHSSTYLSSLMH